MAPTISGIKGSAAGCGMLWLAACAVAQDCTPWWSSEFTYPGIAGTVFDAALFDDGDGPSLFCCGDFNLAGAATAFRIARWDGGRWHALGTGLTGSTGAYAMCPFTDGSGESLFVGGSFDTAGGLSVKNVARWDKASGWRAVGGGVQGGAEPVRCAAVFDDGSGPALYAGGTMTKAGTTTVAGIARWNGAAWSALGPGLAGGSVRGMAVFDEDGPGPLAPALFVSGSFTTAGGQSIPRIARWSGSAWSAVGAGINGTIVRSLVVVDEDGPGPWAPALFAGGQFTSAGVPAVNIARWDGSAWSAVGAGLPGAEGLISLTTADLGAGERLVAAGSRASGSYAVWHWNAGAWAAIAERVNFITRVARGIPPAAGAGPPGGLYIGGEFSDIDHIDCQRIARLDAGVKWTPLGTGYTQTVRRARVLAEPGGLRLYAAGTQTTLGGAPALGVSRLNGAHWEQVGSDLESAYDVAVFDAGAGASVFAAGILADASGAQLLRLDGSSWTVVGTTSGTPIEHMAVCAVAGQPSKLYLTGNFSGLSSPVSISGGFLTWDGSSWGAIPDPGIVSDLLAYDDGSGMKLYASLNGGWGVARWDGAAWSKVGDGLYNGVSQLCAHDDGSGMRLYAVGAFSSSGAAPMGGVARWDGVSWDRVGADDFVAGSGLGGVACAGVVDEGGQQTLWVGGGFVKIGSATVKYLARWDGATWTGLPSTTDGTVYQIADLGGATRPGTYVFGSFSHVGLDVSWQAARWRVPDGVSIEAGPADLTARALARATFSVSAEPGGSVAYGWRRNGSPLNDGVSASGSVVSGSATPSLSIDGVMFEDAGEYDCVVSGPCDSRTTTGAVLSVVCTADFDVDGFVTGKDMDAFVERFVAGDASADINGDSFVSGDDFDLFVGHFAEAC